MVSTCFFFSLWNTLLYSICCFSVFRRQSHDDQQQFWAGRRSKIGRKGYQKKRNFVLISKMCRNLASRSSQRFFSQKNNFLQNFPSPVKLSFFCKTFSLLPNSRHFWNQRKIAILLIPCTPNFEEIFSTLLRGGATFFGGWKVKKERNRSIFKKPNQKHMKHIKFLKNVKITGPYSVGTFLYSTWPGASFFLFTWK